ncbi:MAG: DUF3445 domain-containing protein [Opitutaceae bacterium]|nr:DUF3445 domain-containing protein [Opitutaceae bacterium]
MTALADLFPNQDFRHRLTLKRGGTRSFFQVRNREALMERRRWLDADPTPYVAAIDEAEPLVAQLESLASEWNEPSFRPSTSGSAPARLITLGKAFESDLLLLRPDSANRFVLMAGVVCFPSSWALAEKIGHPLDFIHAVVPGLNSSIGSIIDTFLSRLEPGIAYERSNWGIAATPELNLHPSLNRPRLKAPLPPDRTWIRVEDQILNTGVIREGQSLLLNLIDAALVSLAAQDWIAHSARPRPVGSRMNLN